MPLYLYAGETPSPEGAKAYFIDLQHMPKAFTGPFAQSLDRICRLSVKEAEEGEMVTCGTALLAPGDAHLTLEKVRSGYRVMLDEGELVNRHRPSVDVLFRSVASVVGFSRMMGKNENRTLRNLKICRTLTDEAIEAHHGRVLGSAGDSVIVEFASPVDAIVAAVEFQKNLRERNEAVPPEDYMQFRVGLNLGDVIVEGDNLYGDGVNVAARLEPQSQNP